jgi:hypothetical protein
MMGADGRLIFVGISIARYLIVEIEERTCDLAPEIFGNQVAVAANKVFGLTAARKMECHHQALEKAPAPCALAGPCCGERCAAYRN